MSFKLMLEMEYDGTNYHGFQWQANAPTIQGEIEAAIKKTSQETLRVVTASRTDSGVHARGQVVSFRTGRRLKPERWVGALNYHLPADIAVKSACYVSDDFNVQKDAVSREYRYFILNRKVRSPLMDRYTYAVWQKLDIEMMQSACKLLEGEHDFSPFATLMSGFRSTTVRRMYKAEIITKGDLVILILIASSFLAHQVRNTVGALLSLVSGKYGLDKFKELFQSGKAGIFGPTAPASGLCLMKVSYSNIPVLGECR